MKHWIVRGVVRFLLLLLPLMLAVPNVVAAPVHGNFAASIARSLHYHPDGSDFVTVNGPEFFNRPLYCVNSPFRIDAGDRPELSLYLPGRGGNLRLGVLSARGAQWLSDARTVVARYRAGSMRYDIRDPLLGAGTLRVVVLPMSATKGVVLRVRLDGTALPVTLVWAYGGVNGQKGARGGDLGTEKVPISQFFQLQPGDCRGNAYSVGAGRFTLQSAAATIVGVTPPGATMAVADARQWLSLRGLLASSGQVASLPVLVGRAALRPAAPLFLALQRVDPAGRADSGAYRVTPYTSAQLPQVFANAERHREAIANHVTVNTPDPYINAVVPALCVAGDAVWDAQSEDFMHGAVAWRVRLLGWRGPYLGDDLGWQTRMEQHLVYWANRQNTSPIPDVLPPPDPQFHLTRHEAALHSNGDLSASHYDMNLVYMDALMRHLLWTGNVKDARRFWPVIARHLAWERRLFRRPFGPDRLPLYEAYCCIWASDNLQYDGGGVTHATAYNEFENRQAARIARLIGQNPQPYTHEANLISKAMRRYLWLPRRGWFAEYKDLLGLQRVHPNAALWTYYTTIDEDAATSREAWQMSRFVDTQIPHIPLQGPGVPPGNFTLPTTTWMPYIWSTNNVVMAEAAHTALADWEAGRDGTAFRLFKGCLLDSMFLGLCPGNAGAMTGFDVYRRESQRDFADAVGVDSRALVEGLFGVHPDALAGTLRICPGFPTGWNYASIRHPDFTFAFRRVGLTDTYTVAPRFPRPMTLLLQIAARRDEIAAVTVNGKAAAWRLLPDVVGRPRIEIRVAPAPRDTVRITWAGAPLFSVSVPPIIAQAATLRAQFGAARVVKVADPQHTFQHLVLTPHGLYATVVGRLGDRCVFVRVRQGQLAWWQPVTFQVRPAFEIVPEPVQDAASLRFRIRNNTPHSIAQPVTLSLGGHLRRVNLRVPAFGLSAVLAPAAEGLLPGANRVLVALGGGRQAAGWVTDWNLRAGAGTRWECVNLTSTFNDRVTHIFQNQYLAPRSPYCSLEYPEQGLGGWCDYAMTFAVDDVGLRAVSEAHQGMLTLPFGVPLRTPGVGTNPNIAFTSRWDNYPHAVTIPLSGRAVHAYLLMAGSTDPMQSRFDNGEVMVTYADGTVTRLVLRNPTNWWPIDQDYLIDDYQFRRPGPAPPRVNLLTGQVRMLNPDLAVVRGGKVPGGAANVLDLPLNPSKPLRSLTVRTLANDVVIGLMSVTLARDAPMGRR